MPGAPFKPSFGLSGTRAAQVDVFDKALSKKSKGTGCLSSEHGLLVQRTLRLKRLKIHLEC
jgi:hypothetical protein